LRHGKGCLETNGSQCGIIAKEQEGTKGGGRKLGKARKKSLKTFRWGVIEITVCTLGQRLKKAGCEVIIG